MARLSPKVNGWQTVTRFPVERSPSDSGHVVLLSQFARQRRGGGTHTFEFNGQNYREGRCGPGWGRVVEPPYFPYTFSDSGDFIGEMDGAQPSKTDIRHHLH